MPDDYKNMDIAKFILDQCKTEAELQAEYEELKNNKFKQQKLSAWRPVPTIWSTTITFLVFGVVFRNWDYCFNTLIFYALFFNIMAFREASYFCSNTARPLWQAL